MDPNQYGPQVIFAPSFLLAFAQLTLFQAPFTPNRSAATDISTPLTEDSKSTLSSRQSRKDTQFVAAAMQSHRLWQKQRKLFDSFPEFKAHVRRVVNEERPSGAKKDSVEKLQEKQEYCQDANEDTILFNLLHLIAKESRQVAKEATVQDGSDQDREKSYEVREFWSDGVVVQVNRLFRNTTLPNAYLQSGLLEDIAKALAKQDGMTQPKPDYTYGIKTDKYLRKDGTQFTDELLDIVPKMHHAFLLVEGKSNKGAMTQGENQACRGGATLVNASRQLLAKLGRVDILGPDKDTFVYSVTMESKVMDIWVHWAEVRMNGKAHEVHFHMNAIASKSLTDDEALPFLRRVLHNILDWGCLDRDRMLKEWYQSLDAYEKRLHDQRVADSQKTQDNKKRKTNK